MTNEGDDISGYDFVLAFLTLCGVAYAEVRDNYDRPCIITQPDYKVKYAEDGKVIPPKWALLFGANGSMIMSSVPHRSDSPKLALVP